MATIDLFFLLIHDGRLTLINEYKQLEFRQNVVHQNFNVTLPVTIRRNVFYYTRVTNALVITDLNAITVTTGTFNVIIRDLYCVPNFNVNSTTAALVKRDCKTEHNSLVHSFSIVAMTVNVAIVKIVNVIVCVFTPRLVNVVAPSLLIHTRKAVTLHVRTCTRPVCKTSVVICCVFVKLNSALIPYVVGLSSV